MDIVLTGTGSPIPDANRAGPSTLVLVTHLHSDHVCDLNDVITTHWITSQGNATLAIYGPVGIAQFVERQMHALEPNIGYRIEHHDALTEGPKVEVVELKAGDSFAVADVTVTTAATDHAPVRPTLGFRLEHGGSTGAIVGDTLPCAGVDELAAGAGAYVQTVIRRDLVELGSNEMFLDILDYHSGVLDAAQTAARVGAQRLVLTHMVPAPTPDQYPEWQARAAEHFDGEIVIGDDLTTITIGPRCLPVGRTP